MKLMLMNDIERWRSEQLEENRDTPRLIVIVDNQEAISLFNDSQQYLNPEGSSRHQWQRAKAQLNRGHTDSALALVHNSIYMDVKILLTSRCLL